MPIPIDAPANPKPAKSGAEKLTLEEQRCRFFEAAREAGASEDEDDFYAALKRGFESKNGWYIMTDTLINVGFFSPLIFIIFIYIYFRSRFRSISSFIWLVVSTVITAYFLYRSYVVGDEYIAIRAWTAAAIQPVLTWIWCWVVLLFCAIMGYVVLRLTESWDRHRP